MCGGTTLLPGARVRCLSTSDLVSYGQDSITFDAWASYSSGAGIRRTSDASSPADYGQAIKRSRSAQGLTALAAAGGTGRASTSSGTSSDDGAGSDASATLAHEMAAATMSAPLRAPAAAAVAPRMGTSLEAAALGAAAAVAAPAAGRGAHLRLPVVFSDHESSTGSLANMEQQQQQQPSPLPSPQQQQQQQNGGVVYLQAAGAASSALYAGLPSPVGASALYRGASDASEHAAGADAAGGLFPLHRPPHFSPPPLFSPPTRAVDAPVATAVAVEPVTAAALPPRGAAPAAAAAAFAATGAFHQQQQQQQPQPMHASRSQEDLDAHWDFGRRHRQPRGDASGSADGANGAGAGASAGMRSGSGSSSMSRRRSSIEASMPWRARVDATIAAAAGDEVGVDAAAAGRSGALPVVAEGSGNGGSSGAASPASAAAGAPASRGSADSGSSDFGAPLLLPPAARVSTATDADASQHLLLFPPSPRRTSNSSSSGRDGSGDGSGSSDAGGVSGSSGPFAPAARYANGGGAAAAGDSPRGAGSGRLGRPRTSTGSAAGGASYYARQAAGGAALELFTRLSRARQTLDFAKRQSAAFAALDIAELSVWEALDMLGSLREYEAGLAPASDGLDATLPLREHAFQVAELCRLARPDLEWFPLVGLVHGLGKLLAHDAFGAQPQWAVAGETFPLGCRFSPKIGGSEFFSANPDRRRRCFSGRETGVYAPRCGLKEVYMSWGAPEYLHLVLVLNQAPLPEEALFLIRYQKFHSLTAGGAYRELLSPADEQALPLLAEFQRLCAYRRIALPAGALRGEALYRHYDALIDKYIGRERLFF